MKTTVLYRPNTDYERAVLDYARDFKIRTGRDLPLMDVDTPAGTQLAETYDILDFPAILVTDDAGHVQNLWMGTTLPTIDEVSYYDAGPSQ